MPIAQAREAADVLDRLGGRLQQHACSVDPRIGEPGLGGTPASSRNRRVSVRRDMCARSASVSRSSGRARFSSVVKRPELIAGGLGAQPFDELRCPHWRCGGATRTRAAELAAAAPWSRRMRWRHRSTPVVMPTEVRMSPCGCREPCHRP